MTISKGGMKLSDTQALLSHVLMDGIQEILMVIKVEENNDFSYAFINQVALDRTYLKNDDIGKSIYEVDSGGDWEKFIANHKKVVETKQILTFEDSYYSPDGTLYYSEVKLTPLFSGSQVSHIVVLIHDITDKKRAEIEIETSKEKLNESRLRYQSLFQYNINLIFSLDLKGNILNANLATKELVGYDPRDTIGMNLKDFIVDEDFTKIADSLDKVREGTAVSTTIKGIDRFNNRLELILKFIPIKIKSKITGVYVILRDVTEEKELIEKLVESEKHFRIITENSEDLISLISKKGKIDYISPSCKNILGLENKDVLGLSYTDFVHPDDHSKCQAILEAPSIKPTRSKVLYRMKNKNDNWVWLEMAVTPVLDEENNLIHLVAISRDMTVRVKYEERLKYLASHDFLTNLENRRSFKRRLAHALTRFKKEQKGLALVMLDIDHFKLINDQYGHDKGDYVLAIFAKQLKCVIGNNGVKFRFGGDEFAVIIEQTNKRDVINLIHAFQRELKHSSHINTSQHLEITTSIGVAYLEGALQDNITEEAFIKTADNALYEAKAAGRNCFKVIEVNEEGRI